MGVTRMEGSKITSKTSSLKALILKAWRHRWSDLHWGIHIKTVLPRGVSGDVYNLADCILQQALVGSGPNHLVLSYLKHSLSSQLVSYAAVLQRIAKYDGFHKPHCVSCLLDFVESIQSGITCRGKPEEGILASAVLSLAHWLLQCYQHAAVTQASQNSLHNKPPAILAFIMSSDFLTAMLTLAKHDDPDLYDDVLKKSQEIMSLHKQDPNITTTIPIQDSLLKLNKVGLGPEVSSEEPLTYILQPILAVLVAINPCIETCSLTNQIKLISKLKGYNGSRLMCEVMRASLLCLYDALGSNEESRWGAFTFLKLPHILSQLEGDIIVAVNQLMDYLPLVELVDSPQSGRSLEALLNELTKIKLISDHDLSNFLARRESMESVNMRLDQSTAQTPIPKVIIRAQLTLQRILKTLDADYTKIQDAILGLLCQVLTGKSFELILAVASVEGELQAFVSKLIRFNEFSKAGPTAKPVLFDITFLMLSYIVQVYGSKVVFGNGPDESFFERWSSECLVERGSPKSPQTILMASDPHAVDTLLSLLNNSQPPDLSSSGLSWDLICVSVPGAMKEVLSAWEQGALTAIDVKRIVDNLKHNMCSLPICAAAWLCTYIQMLEEDSLVKPMNMVQMLLSSGGAVDENSPQASPAAPDNLKERASLMQQVVRKVQCDMHLATKPRPLAHSIISKEPLKNELLSVWSTSLDRGWLSIQATRQLENLFYTGGAEWLVTNLVNELMQVTYQSEIEKAVDLVTAMFHLDMETCTHVLLNDILPEYLHMPSKSMELCEPHSECLARLSVFCLYSALEVNTCRKRPHPPSTDGDEAGGKMIRLDDEVSRCGSSVSWADSGFSAPPLSKLLRLFNSLVESATFICQTTHFIFIFLKLLTLDGRTSPAILHLIPSTLVRGLIRLVPDLFTEQLVLSLYDLDSPSGRKSAASDLCLLRNIQLKPNPPFSSINK